jgi:hypothetical protein
MECHLALADYSKVSTGYNEQVASSPLGLEAAIGRELLFMTILMLHA